MKIEILQAAAEAYGAEAVEIFENLMNAIVAGGEQINQKDYIIEELTKDLKRSIDQLKKYEEKEKQNADLSSASTALDNLHFHIEDLMEFFPQTERETFELLDDLDRLREKIITNTDKYYKQKELELDWCKTLTPTIKAAVNAADGIHINVQYEQS